MRIDRMGEGAAILRGLTGDPARLAASIEAARLPGLIEAVACYDTVGVYFERGFDLDLLHQIEASPITAAIEPVRHEIPVCYEMGEDLGDVARHLGLTEAEVVEEHTVIEYRCHAIGFCPGFPYLGYLSERLSGYPRRPVPRTRIEPGSVAITGRQTGVYPLPRPGGWGLLGRTPLVLVDVEDDFFPIVAGDMVRFKAITSSEYLALRGERL